MTGESLDGLRTTVFPEPKAADVIPTKIAKGKFQGGITTPTPKVYILTHYFHQDI